MLLQECAGPLSLAARGPDGRWSRSDVAQQAAREAAPGGPKPGIAAQHKQAG